VHKEGPRLLKVPAFPLSGVGVYLRSFFAAVSTPPPFFSPPNFLLLLPEEPLTTFLLSFSIAEMLTAHPPLPTVG
jgi:hypothetical protein